MSMTQKQMMALTKKDLVTYLMDAREEIMSLRDAFRNPKTKSLRYNNNVFMSYDSIYKEGYEDAMNEFKGKSKEVKGKNEELVIALHKQNDELKEAMDDYNEWFADINELVGCPRDSGGAVTNVEHYVRQNKKLKENSYTKDKLFDMINDAGLWEKDDDIEGFDFEEWLECDIVLGGEVDCE
jgi:hypothetical protein